MPSSTRIYGKIARRLLPLLFVCYTVAYLDRVNVGFAKLQLKDELWFSEVVFGIGAGIFFVGYILFEVPSNAILHRVGARRWIARIMITWGLLSAAMALSNSALTFYVLRFLLGAAEAGFIPGILLYLTYWFPAHRRGRIVALLLTGIPMATIFGGPLSGWILEALSGTGGLDGWQWLFVLEAIPALLLGFVVLRRLDDNVGVATWLDEDEKAVVRAEIAADDETKSDAHSGMGAALRSGRVWLLGAVYFPVVLGIYTLSFWLPTIVSDSGVRSAAVIGLLSAVPYVAAAVAMVAVAAHGDRSGERRWHTVVPGVLAGVALVAGGLLESSTVPALIALTVAAAGIHAAQSAFWSLPSALLAGAGAAAGLALINSVGNIAGAVGPSLTGFLTSSTGSTATSLYLVGAVMVVGALLVLVLRPEQVDDRVRRPTGAEAGRPGR